MLSVKILIIAIFAGFLTAFFSTFIDSIFAVSVTKRRTETVGNITKNSLLLGCTGSILVSAIFYCFASTEVTPIRMIINYSIILGIVAPILSIFLLLIYFKLSSRS